MQSAGFNADAVKSAVGTLPKITPADPELRALSTSASAPRRASNTNHAICRNPKTPLK